MAEYNEEGYIVDEDYGTMPDIDATVEAIRAAWKIMPGSSLYELLDTVTSMPAIEMSNEELLQELNEFILQNKDKL